MYTQFDEKGKIFTNVVTKKPVRVIVQTTTQRIHGEVHVRPNVRLLDALKDEALFIAITDAIIYNVDNTPLYTAKFLSVNQNQIVWVLPEDEIDQEGAPE